MTLDEFDRRLLALLQENAALSVNELADKVGLSPSPCWRRIQKLEAEGYIRARVALLDPKKMNVGVTVFAAIRTNQHNADWLAAFSRAVACYEFGHRYHLPGDGMPVLQAGDTHFAD